MKPIKQLLNSGTPVNYRITLQLNVSMPCDTSLTAFEYHTLNSDQLLALLDLTDALWALFGIWSQPILY